MKFNFNNETLPFCSEHKYLGVKLGRSRMHRRHLGVTSQEDDITRRAPEAACWLRLGCWTNLRTATLDLVYWTTEYRAPVWCRSAHTRLVNSAIIDALRIVTACLHPTPADNLPILAGIQPAELRCKRSHTVSSTPCHGTWTPAPLNAHPSIEGRCTAPQIETPICVRRTTTHQFIWKQQNSCGALGGSPKECGVGGQLRKIPHLHPRHPAPIPTERHSQEEPGSGLTTTAPVSGVSAPVCTNGLWPLLRPVSVAQKNNRPSSMFSSNVQFIDLLMDCTVWRFWTMRQSNGCSTSAPRSSAAMQWLEKLAQKKKKT